MSLFEDELDGLTGRVIVVVMSDGSKFRGKLINHDAKILILEDIYELSDRLQWIPPVIYTSVSKSITKTKDVVDQAERGYLNMVLINTSHIIRIWPYEPKKIE